MKETAKEFAAWAATTALWAAVVGLLWDSHGGKMAWDAWFALALWAAATLMAVSDIYVDARSKHGR